MPRDKAGCYRPVLSCTRCRLKKIKCDKRFPCSQCEAAKTACSRYQPGSRDEAPRSITQFLQSEIDRLEAKLGYNTANQRDSVMHPSPFSDNGLGARGPGACSNNPHSAAAEIDPSHEIARFRIRACPSIQKIISATSPSDISVSDMSRIRMGLTPSQVLAPPAWQAGNNKAMLKSPDPNSVLDVRKLASIPPIHVNALVTAYIRQVHHIHPYVHAPTLSEQVSRVLQKVHKEGPIEITADYDFLVVYIVLAISVSLGSATSGHGPRRMVFSEALFREGIQHLSGQKVFKSEMAELQVTLLMLHYGTINPRCASVWLLGGAAMRHCLKLGLHRELPKQANMDPLGLDIRRRVFWMAYCLERQICAALQYPISLSDTAINVEDFSLLDDKGITSGGISSSTDITKEPASHWLGYRRLHSYMAEVHFHNKPLREGLTWEDWVAEMEVKLRHWYAKHQADYPWTETAYYNSLTYLHRPSPRRPLPSPDSLLIAFENACTVASTYRDDIFAGYLRRPWLAALHTFGSAAIVLFCLRHGANEIATKFTADQVYEMTKLFTTSLQSISSHSWPEASQCAVVYERLLTPLIEAILSGSNPKDSFTAEQDMELARMLYPGTSQYEVIGLDTSKLLTPFEDIFNGVDVLDWDFSHLFDIPLDEASFRLWNSSLGIT